MKLFLVLSYFVIFLSTNSLAQSHDDKKTNSYENIQKFQKDKFEQGKKQTKKNWKKLKNFYQKSKDRINDIRKK